MATVIEQTTQTLLESFNQNKTLKKILNYFKKNPVLTVFFDELLAVNNEAVATNDWDNSAKLVLLPLVSQRLFLTDQTSLTDLIGEVQAQLFLDQKRLPNYEQEISVMVPLTPEETTSYFSFHQSYEVIALFYASPFLNNPNYETIAKFFYYLIMYINLELSFNKFMVNDDFNPFLIKMEVQLIMITLLANLDPQKYNKSIRQLNKWFNKKALYKVVAEQKKLSEEKK